MYRISDMSFEDFESLNEKISTVSSSSSLEEDVKTVFGFGGCYLHTSLFFTTIIFVREYLEEEQVKKFMMQTNLFKTATLSLSSENKIFC